MKRRIKSKIKKREMYLLLHQNIIETMRLKRLIEQMLEPSEMRVVTSP